MSKFRALPPREPLARALQRAEWLHKMYEKKQADDAEIVDSQPPEPLQPSDRKAGF